MTRPSHGIQARAAPISSAEEAAAAAVAKLRADLPDVTCRDLRAAQRAIGLRARHAVVDENKAQHFGLRCCGLAANAACLSSPPFAEKTRFRERLFPQSPFSDRAGSFWLRPRCYFFVSKNRIDARGS